jgi:hypothetical protein
MLTQTNKVQESGGQGQKSATREKTSLTRLATLGTTSFLGSVALTSSAISIIGERNRTDRYEAIGEPLNIDKISFNDLEYRIKATSGEEFTLLRACTLCVPPADPGEPPTLTHEAVFADWPRYLPRLWNKESVRVNERHYIVLPEDPIAD